MLIHASCIHVQISNIWGKNSPAIYIGSDRFYLKRKCCYAVALPYSQLAAIVKS